MLRFLSRKKADTAGTRRRLKAGDKHYRAYVGPPEDYDLISAMVFNLLTSIGLRENHRVLDIGCGSLRVGRLLIPYLATGNYFGVEPNRWLVKDGIRHEVGRDLVRIRKPQFSFRDSLRDFTTPLNLDFAIAQSIFSHCGKDLVRGWLSQISPHLSDRGALLATYLPAERDCRELGWIYPGCVGYRSETMVEMANEVDLAFAVLDWAHPRLTWVLFSKRSFDRSLIDGGPISWNRRLGRDLR